MRQQQIEVIQATPDLLNEAVDASLEAHQQRSKWSMRMSRALFQTCAFCVTSGGSGLLAGHLGCVIAPLATTIAPETALLLSPNPYDPVLMFKIGFVINTAVLGTWYAVRGRHVTRPIQMATVGIALGGLVVTTAVKTPHMVDMQAAYEQLTNGDEGRRAELIESARLMGQTLDQRLMAICGTPTGPTAKMTSWQKIRYAFTH